MRLFRTRPLRDYLGPQRTKFGFAGMPSLGMALRVLNMVVIVACVPARLMATESSAGGQGQLQPGQMPYFDAVPDPLEGFNRCSWAVNEWLFRHVIYPLSIGYNHIVPQPLRLGIGNAGHNITYPVRLVNNCLQGKWRGAWSETERFGVNTTVGVGGLFDPSTRWKIGRSNQDFGETLGHYGNGPGFYLVIPLLGPSNGRDAVGRLVDLPLDPCTWLGNEYPTQLWPYCVRPGITFNDLSGRAGDLRRELDSFVDPYQAVRTLYSLNRQRLIADYKPRQIGEWDPNPTLKAVLFKPITKDFADRSVTRRVLVAATGKKMAYSCWMQEKPAPLVCYLPGLGAYRLERATLAYADMLYRHGYSVVTFSNPFQSEFMDSAATVAIPGYGPADCDDVENALKAVMGDVQAWQKGKITRTCLTGVSHGGYFTLMIAAREASGRLSGFAFDRYVAVNPPPRLARAATLLDQMFDAPLAWPAEERRQRMEESVYKALYFSENGLDVSGDIPLTRTESNFLIGLAFRYTLMNVIEDSQKRENLGVLKQDPRSFVRQESVREIREINYTEYKERFVVPYLIKTGRAKSIEDVVDSTDLTNSTEAYRNNPKIRVQVCEDDFLLTPGDIPWFRATFGKNLTDYQSGGHLGNLHVPAVQETLVRMFSD